MVNSEIIKLQELRRLAVDSLSDCYNIEVSDPHFIEYNENLQTTAGYCEWNPGEVVKICLNPLIRTRRDLLEVFAHELSHGVQVVLTGSTAHDPEFYGICKRILYRFGLYSSEPYRLHSIPELAAKYQKRRC